MEVRAKVARLLEEAIQAPPGRIRPEQRLDAVEGMDSMGIVQFLGSISDHFGVVVSVDELTTCVTVKDLLGLVEGAIARAQA